MAKSQIKELTEKDFDKKVIKSSKPVLIKFVTPWCQACKSIEPIIDELANKYLSKIEIYNINIEKNQKISSKYHIMTLPTLLVFKNGKIVNHIVNSITIKELENKLTDHLSD